MEIKEMTIEQLEERKNQITAELEAPEADLDALEEEARSINERIAEIRKQEAEKAEARKAVADGAGKITEKIEERKEMKKTNEEVRASKEYIDAFARYLVSENDTEVRSLLTETVSGSVPVPTIVDEIIHTAWETDEILQRVKKTFVRGNLKVAFELSADGAYVHTEGTSAPTEESLSLGIVSMVPSNIKKWIRVSDEAVAMGGEALVRYIYDELTYQITKKLADLVVNDIATLTTAGSTAPGAAAITEAPSLTTISKAFANLSDEARDVVIIMNKLTYANFVAAQAAGNFAFDPFMNLPVLFNNSLPAYDTASANAVYAIVGDLSGAQINYPEGDGIAIKYDDLSEAESDLVKIVGRQYAAHAVVANKSFTNVKKPSGSST